VAVGPGSAERGRVAARRVQRVPDEWPVVHLEAEPPAWAGLSVGGMVDVLGDWDLDRLVALGPERRTIALHCVWGWSRPDTVWDGVTLGRVLEASVPGGSWVTVRAASDTYSSCLPIEDAARGMLAWARDGERLSAEAGGPLRFVPPAEYWNYKGVKWASRVDVWDRFVPGFWETRVADPMGRIPAEVELP
jgi:DMSO/TMAO reductase YedYZ molybdopterin-dependent catalytic subunit